MDMKKVLYVFLGIIVIVLCISPVYSQERIYHGGDAVFQAEDVGVFWAVLKGEDFESSQVVINIVPNDLSTCEFSKYSVFASNVFTGEERILVDFQDLEEENLLIQAYGEFNQLSKRRIIFYSDKGGNMNPAMEIYYAGMPDTSPVLMDETQIDLYFKHSKNMVKNNR